MGNRALPSGCRRLQDYPADSFLQVENDKSRRAPV